MLAVLNILSQPAPLCQTAAQSWSSVVAPTGAFGDAIVQTASSGSVSLNNTGDTIIVNDGSSDRASLTYTGTSDDNQSLTRDPDISGPEPLVFHSTATGSGGALFSPGTQIDGTPSWAAKIFTSTTYKGLAQV